MITDQEYSIRILISIKNDVKISGIGETEYGTGELNLEDVLSALRRNKQGGIDKPKLRELLTKLVERGLLEIIEGKKQAKPQSKGSYKITAEGITALQNYHNNWS